MNFRCGLTAKNWQNNYLQSVNGQGKSLRLVGLPGPKGLHEIKSTKKQLRVGGIRVWGFLLARGLEAPLTVKMPGNYGVNCVANTTSRTCVKGRCFSPPLLICLLLCLLQTERQRQLIRQASAQPVCIWHGMESWSLVCPYRPSLYLLRTTCQATQLPCHFELAQSHCKGNYGAPKPTHTGTWLLLPGILEDFSWGTCHQMGNSLERTINSLQIRWVLRPCSRWTNHTALGGWSGASEIS